jgi:hypothetical protein
MSPLVQFGSMSGILCSFYSEIEIPVRLIRTTIAVLIVLTLTLWLFRHSDSAAISFKSFLRKQNFGPRKSIDKRIQNDSVNIARLKTGPKTKHNQKPAFAGP